MTDKHPITPPLELVQQWSDIKPMEDAVVQNWVKIATKAAQWGADQELEACLEWLVQEGYIDAPCRLRAARRPKPPSLKEQALAALKHLELIPDPPGFIADMDTIRHALEQLND